MMCTQIKKSSLSCLCGAIACWLPGLTVFRPLLDVPEYSSVSMAGIFAVFFLHLFVCLISKANARRGFSTCLFLCSLLSETTPVQFSAVCLALSELAFPCL